MTLPLSGWSTASDSGRSDQKMMESIGLSTLMVNGLLIAAFSVFLAVAGLMWVNETQGTYTSALKLPLNIVFYAALPVTSIMSVWFAVKRLKSGQFSELDASGGDEVTRRKP